MPDTTIRDWLALFVSSLSALFAGLIWLLARKKLGARYEFSFDTNIEPHIHGFKIEVTNRTDSTIVIEAISAQMPLSILTDQTGGHYGAILRRDLLAEAKHVSLVNVHREIAPDTKMAWTISLYRDGGFQSCRSVSIALHILTSFPVIRHKKKVLKAILPASMRK